MMASSARHLALVVAVLVAVAAPRARADSWGAGRFFFSKTTRPQAAAVDEPAEKAAASATGTTAVPGADAADPNSATAAFSRPSTGGSGGRGYGLYGRPEENFPPDYFRRGVHRNAEKLTTTGNVPTTTTSGADEAAVPVGGRVGERAEDNGSGRGRAPWTYDNVPTPTSTVETVPVGGRGGAGESERAEPFEEDNGSGWGRPPKVYRLAGAEGRRPEQEEEQRGNDFGMSDTRLYQNGRYYYDVDAGRYGYGRESNPVRTTRPDQEFAAGDRRGGVYGNAAAGYYQNGNGNEFGNGVMENRNGFQEEGQNGRYIP